ncbi:TetR/AcrR family transcriptional regulator [Labilibaculum sp.]|uniref:TetR/AcrR family transcriptional regulator n=1 Tax=Labilibaculum sp. TaxID=2060723 RepID=UPI003565778B
MKTNTKQKILDAGVRLMHEKGFNDTGLQEILKEASVPKGSFYFYFKNKQDFGIQVIDCFFQHFKSVLNRFTEDASMPHVQRLQTFFSGFLDFFVNGDFKGGCPIGNFTLEMADVNEDFREHLNLILEQSIDLIANQIKYAQEKKEIQNVDDPKTLAEFIFFSWEGMIMQMKVSKDRKHLEQFNCFVFNQLIRNNKM